MQLLNGGFDDEGGETDDSSAPSVPLSPSAGDDQLFLRQKHKEQQTFKKKKKKAEQQTFKKKANVLQSIINATVKKTTAHVVPMNERSIKEQDQVTNPPANLTFIM